MFSFGILSTSAQGVDGGEACFETYHVYVNFREGVFQTCQVALNVWHMSTRQRTKLYGEVKRSI